MLSAVSLSLARWQFATTSIYHFIFVPITIGMSFLVALLQTTWYRSGKDVYRRLARFFGTLLLINVAVGVVTGLVQEFEFGMNWSNYSRFVGDVFGGPLAMEGLAAFFLESTFLGLWIFGWDRLPKGIHLACIWVVAFATMLSAACIMAANSWMQHPVGYVVNPVNHRAELTDVWALFTNPVFLWGYLHIVLASLVTGALLMLAVSAWHLRRGKEVSAFRLSATIALAVLMPAITLAMFIGDELGVIEARYQPMKIAAAEAQWTTCQPCSFSLFQIGGGSNDQTPTQIIAVPHGLSLLATNSWNGKVIGLSELNAEYQEKYGPGNYVPNVFVQYWSMRVMAYVAGLVFLFGLWGIWLLQRRKLEHAKWFLRLAVWGFLAPIVMNSAGWLLTEVGRQPWIVQGLMLTKNGVSPNITTLDIAISLTVFVLIYAVLGVAEGVLMVRFARRDLEPEQPTPDEGGGPSEGAPETGDERIPELVY